MRFLFRLVLFALLAGGVAYALGYRLGDVTGIRAAGAGARAAAGAAAGSYLDSDRIREAGSELAAKVGAVAPRAEAALDQAKLTAKIKAKMALDDTLEGSRIDVDTEGTVVTVSGVVTSAAQRDRALQLARETRGVTSVDDRLEITRP